LADHRGRQGRDQHGADDLVELQGVHWQFLLRPIAQARGIATGAAYPARGQLYGLGPRPSPWNGPGSVPVCAAKCRTKPWISGHNLAAMPDRPLIVVPARLAATRLPGKPLAPINGVAMIAHVAARALEARVGPVVVAAAEAAIEAAVAGADFAALSGGPSPGAVAVELTDPDLPSGSDRVWAAVCRYDP